MMSGMSVGSALSNPDCLVVQWLRGRSPCVCARIHRAVEHTTGARLAWLPRVHPVAGASHQQFAFEYTTRTVLVFRPRASGDLALDAILFVDGGSIFLD